MEKIKVAVIGTGSISRNHIKAYQNNPNVELYAFCDINENRVKAMAETYGVTRIYTDKDVMLRELPELDAVSVCTWNSAHAPCTIAALNAGCHVLCEKPMAVNAEEARQMKAAAEKNGKLLMIGFVRRFEEQCEMLLDHIKNGTLGNIYYGKAVYLRRNGFPGGWFGDKSRSAGGPLIDLGVHIIDLTRYLCGNPKPVSVYAATFDKLKNRPDIKDPRPLFSSSRREACEIFDVEDLATAMIRYDNGAVIAVDASFSLNIREDIRYVQLFGDKGGAKLDDNLELYTEYNGYMSNLQPATPFNPPHSFNREINHFVDCIVNGAACKSPVQDGITIMEILDAIYESARTGHEVQL